MYKITFDQRIINNHDTPILKVYLTEPIRSRRINYTLQPYIYFSQHQGNAFPFKTKKAALRNLELLKRIGHKTAKLSEA